MGRIKEVHVPSFSLTQTGHLAKHLSSHGVKGHTLRNREVVGPVCTHNRVVLVQMSTNTNRNRLLAGGEVHLTGHGATTNVEGKAFLDMGRQLALQIDLCHRLLVQADQGHGFVHPEQLVASRLHR
jgi:hypothetical protein